MEVPFQTGDGTGSIVGTTKMSASLMTPSPRWGTEVDLSALATEFNHPTVVRMFFYPSDLEALLVHVPEAAIGTPVLGQIDVCIGHPVRPGLVRAERSDGSFMLVPLTKWPPFCVGCTCFRRADCNELVRAHCRACGTFEEGWFDW